MAAGGGCLRADEPHFQDISSQIEEGRCDPWHERFNLSPSNMGRSRSQPGYHRIHPTSGNGVESTTSVFRGGGRAYNKPTQSLILAQLTSANVIFATVSGFDRSHVITRSSSILGLLHPSVHCRRRNRRWRVRALSAALLRDAYQISRTWLRGMSR
jgi:hypothetical protein